MTAANLLITGATGLVGQNFAPRAVAAGYNVLAMVRRNSDRTGLAGVPLRFVEGDLAEPETLPAAVAEADIVVHAAAQLGDWGPPEKYRAINVVALEHMLCASQQTGRLRRWIQISSQGVYPVRHHHGTDESVPRELNNLDGYTQTKAEAEVVVQRHVREHGLPAVILRPGFIYGPGERHALTRVVEKIQAGKMKLIGRGDRLLNNTAIENLCDAILLAIETPGIDGETFNIRDERLVTREEFVHAIADYLGKPHPRYVPERLAKAIVGPIEAVARLRGRTTPPILTHGQIKFLTQNLDYSIAKAKRVLGYRPHVDFQDGIVTTLDALTGKCPPRKSSSSQRAAAAIA
jgi:nucleoside-diphosphate-sugar epimerase